MKRTLNKPIRDEKGQALILVLVLLLVGALIITPLLGYMGTGLKTGQVYEKKTDGLYAADAGVEDALWRIKYLDEVPTEEYNLTEQVNGMAVSVDIEEDIYFYGEKVGEGRSHPDWFEVASELVDYYEKEGSPGVYIYGYQLTLTNKTDEPVKLGRPPLEGGHGIIISCPIELEYIGGLYTNQADLDEGRLAPPPMNDFDSGVLDDHTSDSTRILTWDFPSPRPEIAAAPDPENEDYTTVTTTFELEGPAELGIFNFLVGVTRSDIGTVWELKPFIITARASDEEGTLVTTVTARALRLSAGGTVSITHWETE